MTAPTDTPATSGQDPTDTEIGVLIDAEQSLTDVLESFHEEIAVEVDNALAAMRKQIAWVHTLIANANIAHEQATSVLGTNVEDVPSWHQLREYQTVFTTTIVTALENALETTPPEEAVYKAATTCIDRLVAYSSTLPRTVDLPDVTSIYQVVDTDDAGNRFRKRLEQTSRRFRRIGKRIRAIFQRNSRSHLVARRVEVQFLADYHVKVRVAKLVERSHEETQQRLSLALSKVEDALSPWLLDQISAEHKLDSVEHHHPPHAPIVDASDSDDDDVDSSAGTREELAQRVHESIARLRTAFAEALACFDDSSEPIVGNSPDMRNVFDEDIHHAGTFLLRRRERKTPKPSRDARIRLDRSVERWRRWHMRLIGRLKTVRHIIALRRDLIDTEDRLLKRLYESAISPLYGAFARIKVGLQQAIEETESACDRYAKDQSFDTLTRKLQGIQRDTLARLRTVLREVPGIVSANEALTDPGRAEWEETLGIIAKLPEKISVHRARGDGDMPFALPAPNFTINLRSIATDAIDPPLPSQLTKTAQPLMQRIVQAWDGAAKVEDIIQFNLGATLDELTEGETDSTEADNQVPVIDRARELAIQALRRSIDTLDDLAATLSQPWAELERTAFESHQDDWADVQRRIQSEGAIEERLVGLRTRTTRSVERMWSSTKSWAIRASHRVKVVGSGVVRLGKHWIARGQAVVGTQEIAGDESTETLDIITDLPAIQARLPLVYRKLFSFEPLTEPSLLEGRVRDLVRVRKHFQRWQSKHDAGVFVLSSRLGDGRTTFLNVLKEKVFADCEVRYASFDQRIRTTNELAKFLAEKLEVELEPNADLSALRDILTARVGQDQPLVCMLDNLEHIVLQGTGTNQLIEEALMFFSRTDRQVYWIATIGYESWRFITKTTGSATGFVTYHALTPIDRGTVETLIFSRHRRSGIPVSFATPNNPSPILRQRLRRARTEEKRQAILRKEYFDALYANAEQDIRLALFYWIRSVDFETRDDEVFVRPFEPLPFRFLSNLDQIRSFTLKAFVVHNTLSLDEHRSIFRLPEDESVFVLESLLNERLIEPVAIGPKSSPSDTGVLPGRSYRIRRLALNPVIKHLRGKHFIY